MAKKDNTNNETVGKKTIKKIASATVFGDSDDIKKYIDGGEKELYKVFGLITDVKIIETTMGISPQFKGAFEAMNCETGEIFTSSTCYLPSVIADLITANKQEGVTMQFAGTVLAEYSKKSAVGYTYSFIPAVNIQESDALINLRNQTLAIGAN